MGFQWMMDVQNFKLRLHTGWSIEREIEAPLLLLLYSKKWHDYAGLAAKLQATVQDHSMLHQQSQACQDMWQQMRQYTAERVNSLTQQQHTNMLQLVRHQFHQMYWNMQNTRRIVHSVHVAISQNRQLTCTLWIPQTPSDMQRLDPYWPMQLLCA